MTKKYAKKLASDNAANRRHSREERDIAGDYPKAGNRRRRMACERDLKRFLETYFKPAFRLAWSADHLRVIGRIQACILGGGLFALGMPRGSGKSSIAERGALWGLLYGHRRFVCLIAATEKLAEDMLDHLKTELQVNDLLAADFRHVCHAVRRLENNARRCVGQLFRGEQTRIVWSSRRLTFPTMPDNACSGTNVSGSTVSVAGLTGALKGQSHTLVSGEIIRPDLTIIDDAQTRESAMSPSQSDEREAIIRGDVLGMAGPGKKIAALLPCTVVRTGDLSDRLLDRERNPQWQGERTKAVYGWPANEALWEEYHRLRAESFRAERGGEEATEFYRQNREAMDAGAILAWPERFNPDELSAVQHVMNLRADIGEAAFAAEHQNDPLMPEEASGPALTATDVATKLNGLKRGVAPPSAEYVTAFIDVHDALLFWCVTAWSADFSGFILDYGTYPRQGRRIFTLRKAAPTLADVRPKAGRQGAVRAGLDALASELLGREWPREDGTVLRVGKCLVDSGYVPDTVFDFCRHSVFASVLLPSRGFGVGARKAPMSEWPKKPGELHGWFWLVGRTTDRAGRQARFDSNHWKAFLRDRFATALADRGSLSLYGASPDEHQLFSEHMTAEFLPA